MRAITVNESQEFERGRDPKKTLGLGFHELIEKQVDKIVDLDHSKPGGWSCTYEANYDRDEGVLVISTYPGDSCSTYLKSILDELGIGQFFKSWYSYPDEYAFQLKAKYKKNVNEAQEFERGKDPKRALDIGGINLHNSYEDNLNDLRMQIDANKMYANEEWEEYIRKVLAGKTITAKMRHMPGFNVKTKQSSPSKGQKEFTIRVKDAKPGEDISDAIDRNFQISPQIIVASEENDIYSITLTPENKIYVEE